MSGKIWTLQEVATHCTAESCWVIIKKNVYDITEFLGQHPGGTKSILRLAGKDATEDFELIHPEGTLEDNMSKLTLVGRIEESGKEVKDVEKKVELPALENQLNLYDFESTAKTVLSAKAWAYYFSGSDDLVTKDYNSEVYRRVLLRPRVFVDSVVANTSSSIAGYETTLPLFVAPAAMARLAHASGEKGIAQACEKEGILQIVSNNASMKFQDIVADAPPNQRFFFQLYVQNDRAQSESLLRQVIGTGKCHAIVLTLDAPTPGKREMDERVKNEDNAAVFSESSGLGESSSGGLGKALFAGTAADLTWHETLPWLRSQLPFDMPIILKGVQTYEDAILAAEHPEVSAIILSNHGGRAMDSAQPPLMILQELQLNAPQVFDRIEVHIDGGIRRGTDVVKALCLGATQVGIGRAALYGLAGYGPLGVQRTIQILRQEIETAMRLLGVNHVSQLGQSHVNTRQLDLLVHSPSKL